MEPTIDRFGGKEWQGRPRGGYWLAAGMHTWPEMGAAGLGQVGAFVTAGAWACSFGRDTILKQTVKAYRRAGGFEVDRLTSLGLWTPIERGDYVTKTIAELRSGRGRAGLVMRISRLAPECPEALRAGFAAFGLWALAASWSLTSGDPGYIPTDVALSIGKARHVAALWDSGLWIAAEHGFLMHQGAHPIERRWQVARDDERATIPPALRSAVHDRDGWACLECGATADLTLDHIVPWSIGGPDTYENLRTLCRPCNSSKGDRTE